MKKNTEKQDDLNVYNSQWPIFHALKIIGPKWKLPILWGLMDTYGLHYNELKRKVNGITNTMLTKCLKELEADGIILRHDFKTIPPSVKYKLTKSGEDLLQTLNELYKWGEKQKWKKSK
jgi:DNA-binding HxlR family transcriptional regulator